MTEYRPDSISSVAIYHIIFNFQIKRTNVIQFDSSSPHKCQSTVAYFSFIIDKDLFKEFCSQKQVDEGIIGMN